MNTRNDLHGLTIFRFIAAFYVFLFHCNLRYKLDASELIQSIIRNGAVGMTFFFVLSGFVLAWSSRNGIRNDYYRARIARIYPAYLIMGLVTIPFLFDYEWGQIKAFIPLFLTATQSWITTSFNSWNFAGSWSVSTELFFYLVFPLLLPVIRKHPKTALIISIAASSLIIPLSLAISKSTMFPQYYVSPVHRLPEFVAGVALGCMFAEGFKLRKWNLPFFLMAITVMIFISPNDNQGWMKNNYVTLPATCLIIYYLATSSIEKSSLTAPFIYLGKISYSFYLMQLPIMLYIIKYHDSLTFMPTWMVWCVIGAINIIMAAACYHFIEDNKAIKFSIMNWKCKPRRSTNLH